MPDSQGSIYRGAANSVSFEAVSDIGIAFESPGYRVHNLHQCRISLLISVSCSARGIWIYRIAADGVFAADGLVCCTHWPGRRTNAHLDTHSTKDIIETAP